LLAFGIIMASVQNRGRSCGNPWSLNTKIGFSAR